MKPQIQIFPDRPMTYAKRVTTDNKQTPRIISCHCRDMETTDRKYTAKLFKNEEHIGSNPPPPPKKKSTKYNDVNYVRDRNENTSSVRRMCVRSDQPKIETYQ